MGEIFYALRVSVTHISAPKELIFVELR